MKNKKLLWIGFVLSFLFLFLAVKGFEVRKLIHIASNLRVTHLLLASFIYFTSYAVRAIRWKYFFPKENQISLNSSLGSFFIGNFGNNIFPARLGDVWRIVLLHSRYDIPKSLTLGATIVEKIFDAIAILISGFLALFTTNLPNNFKYTVLGLTILIVLSFFIVWYLEERYESKFNLPEKVIWLFKNLKLALKPLRNPGKFIEILIVTLFSWGIELISFYFFFSAFNLVANLSLLTLTMFSINIAVSIPSAPSNIGTFEYGMVLAGSLLSYDKSTMFTIALITHFLRFVVNVLAGLAYAIPWHFKIKE